MTESNAKGCGHLAHLFNGKFLIRLDTNFSGLLESLLFDEGNLNIPAVFGTTP